MKFTSTVTINSLAVIESLAQDEFHTGRYLLEDLSGVAVQKEFPLFNAPTESKQQFLANLERLTAHAKGGMRPILHLEIHGTKDGDGVLLEPSKEKVS